MLKVARRSFLTSADPAKADFYERAILNGIIGNQNRLASGATSYIYMQPLGGVNTKPWGKSDYPRPEPEPGAGSRRAGRSRSRSSWSRSRSGVGPVGKPNDTA